jgi:PEP-CTERM motif
VSPRLLLALVPIILTGTAQALVLNENTFGDLSNDNLAPTPLSLDLGVNRIGGTMGRDLPSDPVDRDIFTFTLAPGRILTSINVLVFTPTNQSFYAIAPGNTIDDSDPATHLSNTLVKTTGELLDDLETNPYSGGTGLTAPLGPGTYTIWFQELSSVVTYDIAYTVAASPVPEPGTAFFGCAMLAACGAARRRRG